MSSTPVTCVTHGGKRRALLRGLAAAVLGLTLAGNGAAGDNSSQEWSGEKRWAFKVLLDGRDIGEHRFRVLTNGGRQQAIIEAEFAVRFAFITAYEYAHSNVEHWQDGCLSSITSSTDDNGKQYAVNGMAGDGGFSLVRNEQPLLLEQACMSSFAYWQPETLLGQQQLLNSQTGEVQAVSVRFAGVDEVQYKGASISGRHYVLTTADGDINLWYALQGGTWLALEAPTSSGRVLRYEPMLLPDDALGAASQQLELSLH